RRRPHGHGGGPERPRLRRGRARLADRRRRARPRLCGRRNAPLASRPTGCASRSIRLHAVTTTAQLERFADNPIVSPKNVRWAPAATGAFNPAATVDVKTGRVVLLVRVYD